MKFQHAFYLLSLALLSACQTQNHAATNNERLLTLGTVQNNIKSGASSATVIETLGSPNVISTDSEGREVWVYDKFSTESSSSAVSTGLLPGLLVSGHSGTSSKSQTTMTVIIKFNKQHLVRDIAYHRSKF